MNRALHLRTNAKTNLFLRVISRRSDGFHEIETVFQSVDLADDVTIVPDDSGRIDVDMSLAAGVKGHIPSPATNLAYRAARRLVHEGAEIGGARIEITKRIPMGAGLGGGSSNAASVLVGFNEIWNLGLEGGSLRALAGDVGSDVPFCIEGGSALATGRGEKLSRITSSSELWLVLGVSFEPLSTAKIYAQWDGSGSSGGPDEMIEALESGDAQGVASHLHNDLEPVVLTLRPELREKKDVLVKAGALGACVTGSGPTLFGIAAGAAHAREVAARVEDVFDRVDVVRSVPRCVERL